MSMRLPRLNTRIALPFLHDLLAAALAWAGAYWLRFNLQIPPPYWQDMLQTLVYVVPIQAFVFWGFGLYHGVWRYAGLPDLKRIVLAVATAAVLSTFAVLLLRVPAVMPRSVVLMDPILLFLIMSSSRLLYRSWREQRRPRREHKRQPVLVLGAGDAAAALVRELARSHDWQVLGMLDDNTRRHHRYVHGVRVLGRLDEVAVWAERLGAKCAIIAMPSASHDVRRRAVDLCAGAGIRVKTVPAFSDLMSGQVSVSQIREVEFDDLLGRDPIVLDTHGLSALIAGRVVLVTGAGGSIGAELCRQVARFKPGLLVLFEMGELPLYRIEQEFTERFPQVPVACVIGDVKSRARVEQVFATYRPAIVFHAAAYKHVPLMERENAWEAVQNNVLGTQVLARAASRTGVEKFVLISTDKAVNPTNVMGASKRLAEMVCQAQQEDGTTRFVMVRFGNVLGSTGSVIPKFRRQIAQGGPITVTHPDITRYFMSIPEATQLVLQAGLMGIGGEIFVMDMGKPIRIVDLARDMIRFSGLSPEDVDIVFTGLRPGEKLYEELLADDERTLPTPHPKLRIAQARKADRQWLTRLAVWLNAHDAPDDAEVKRHLRRWVPEYQPDGMPGEPPASPRVVSLSQSQRQR